MMAQLIFSLSIPYKTM